MGRYRTSLLTRSWMKKGKKSGIWFIYDHSGITMNTTGFSCPWDSGQVGWIYCSKKRFLSETGYKKDELFSYVKIRLPKVGERVNIASMPDFGQVKSIIGDNNNRMDNIANLPHILDIFVDC